VISHNKLPGIPLLKRTVHDTFLSGNTKNLAHPLCIRLGCTTVDMLMVVQVCLGLGKQHIAIQILNFVQIGKGMDRQFECRYILQEERLEEMRFT